MAAIRVCVVTATRAEYGLLRWIAHDLRADPRFELDLVVTGSHLSGRHGSTVDEIESDGHEITARIPVMLDRAEAKLLAQASATIVSEFAGYLDRRKPDIVLVLGDRWELLPIASACTIAATPIGHFHGGEVTEGALDDGVRHALTKLSHLHFVANAAYGRRVAQLGEEDWRICNCGAPGLDNFYRLQLMDRKALAEDLGMDFSRPTALVAFHSTTRDAGAADVDALVRALDAARDRFGLQYVITAPGADPGADAIEKALRAFARSAPPSVYVPSLGSLRFLSVMMHARLMIGNSSSAYHEAPAAELVAVDIGDRQKGRIKPDNVINVGTTIADIVGGIEKALSAPASVFAAPRREFCVEARDRAFGDRVCRARRSGRAAQEIHRSRDGVMTGKVCVIAEAGVNHNGSAELAETLVRAAAAAGADIVKFQTFKAEELVTLSAPMAKYQERNIGATGTQFAMLKKLELDRSKLAGLSRLAESLGIELISTPFDIESVRFLANEIGVKRLKISSGDMTNAPLLLVAARTRKPIILSTGMATLDEVKDALSVIAFGYIGPVSEMPSREAFKSAFGSERGKIALRDNVTILHCTTEYPAPLETINLRAMDTLSGAFGCSVGLSDHSLGSSAALAAAARGAVMVEKHLTLDRGMEGPDHRASLEPEEFAEMVRAIRQIEAALGNGEKMPADVEKANLYIARKSLVTIRPVLKGEIFTAENLGAKRPGGGVGPMEYWSRLGTVAARDYRADEQIDP